MLVSGRVLQQFLETYPPTQKIQTSPSQQGTLESINHFSHGEKMLINSLPLISHHYKGHDIFITNPTKMHFEEEIPSKLPYTF